MKTVNTQIIDFLKYGKLFNLEIGNDKSLIFEKLNEPNLIEEYKNGIYFHYDIVRFLIEDDKVEEITILFKYADYVYEINDFQEIIDEKFISKDFKLHSMLCFLNYLKIGWQIVKENQSYDYIKILLNNQVDIIYYLYTGELERISFSKKITPQNLNS